MPREVSYHWNEVNGFEAKKRNARLTACNNVVVRKSNFVIFPCCFVEYDKKKCTKSHNAHGVGSYFFIQPIKIFHPTNQQYDWLNENSRAARAVRTYEHFYAALKSKVKIA